MQCFRNPEAQDAVFDYLMNVSFPFGNLNSDSSINIERFLKRPIVRVKRNGLYSRTTIAVWLSSNATKGGFINFSMQKLSDYAAKNDMSTSQALAEINYEPDFDCGKHRQVLVKLRPEQAEKIYNLYHMYQL